MRVFKTKAFQRWFNKQLLTNEDLLNAISEIEVGLVDANLGSFLYKKRIAIKGRGKRGSVRTLLALKRKDKAFFLYGFEKNQKDNLTINEAKAYKLIAKTLIRFTDRELEERMHDNSLIEI